jgi:hypothetical protein
MQYVELMVLSGREHNVMDLLKKKIEMLVEADDTYAFLMDVVVCHFRKGVSQVSNRVKYSYEKGVKSYLFIGADLMNWTNDQLEKLYCVLTSGIPFVIGLVRKWQQIQQRLFTSQEEIERMARNLGAELEPEIRLVLPENETDTIQAIEIKGVDENAQAEKVVRKRVSFKEMVDRFKQKVNSVGQRIEEREIGRKSKRVLSLSYYFVHGLLKRHLPQAIKPNVFIPTEWMIKWLPVLIEEEMRHQGSVA